MTEPDYKTPVEEILERQSNQAPVLGLEQGLHILFVVVFMGLVGGLVFWQFFFGATVEKTPGEVVVNTDSRTSSAVPNGIAREPAKTIDLHENNQNLDPAPPIFLGEEPSAASSDSVNRLEVAQTQLKAVKDTHQLGSSGYFTSWLSELKAFSSLDDMTKAEAEWLVAEGQELRRQQTSLKKLIKAFPQPQKSDLFQGDSYQTWLGTALKFVLLYDHLTLSREPFGQYLASAELDSNTKLVLRSPTTLAFTRLTPSGKPSTLRTSVWPDNSAQAAATTLLTGEFKRQNVSQEQYQGLLALVETGFPSRLVTQTEFDWQVPAVDTQSARLVLPQNIATWQQYASSTNEGIDMFAYRQPDTNTTVQVGFYNRRHPVTYQLEPLAVQGHFFYREDRFAKSYYTIFPTQSPTHKIYFTFQQNNQPVTLSAEHESFLAFFIQHFKPRELPPDSWEFWAL